MFRIRAPHASTMVRVDLPPGISAKSRKTFCFCGIIRRRVFRVESIALLSSVWVSVYSAVTCYMCGVGSEDIIVRVNESDVFFLLV